MAEYAGFEFRYDCDLRALPATLADRFVPLALDEQLRNFVDAAPKHRASRFKAALRSALVGFWSEFDVHAWLGMYPMHLLSEAQLAALIARDCVNSLLDVGAGSGDVTRAIAPMAARVVTTEHGEKMVRRLRSRGFECHGVDVSRKPVPGAPYDLITCFNVLDRCARPETLLSQLRDALAEGGQLVLATPIPYSPFYYAGAASRDPVESLPAPEDSWEETVAALVSELLSPVGLEVVAFARCPYLSGGDPGAPLYVLDDALFCCRAMR